MPPPPPPKRIKRPATVLDEDVYTDALSEIIARDFFPGLQETKAKQEYLDALDSKDGEWIAAARGRLGEVLRGDVRGSGKGGGGAAGGAAGTRYNTPTPGRQMDRTPMGYGGDTPMSMSMGMGMGTPGSVTSTSTTTTTTTGTGLGTKREVPDISNLGLVGFQAKYTSEDNESFNKLLDKQNAKRREKYAWLWSGNKIPSGRQLAHMQAERKKLVAQGGNPGDLQSQRLQLQQPQGQSYGEDQNQGEGQGQGYEQKDQQQQQLIKTDLAARPAKPDAWKTPPENSLMFIPDSVEDSLETVQQRAEAVSRAGPKRVIYQNTRLPDSGLIAAEQQQQQQQQQKEPPSPSLSTIKDAIAGRPRLSENESIATSTGGETPRVNGYSFVDEDEPTTTTTTSSTGTTTTTTADDLNLLGKPDSTPNPFQLRETRKREDLHHRLVDRVARTRRAEKAARECKTPVSRFPGSPALDLGLRGSGSGSGSPGLGSVSGGGNASASATGKALTPAAQKLLRRVGSTPQRSGSMSSSTNSSNLRNMWTPSGSSSRRRK